MNIEKIQQHYDHAREKHPYFCDKLLVDQPVKNFYHGQLNSFRMRADVHARRGDLSPEIILNEEIAEIWDSIEANDIANAIEECYDSIAVLLRVIDVLEGRQPLGKPKEGAK